MSNLFDDTMTRLEKTILEAQKNISRIKYMNSSYESDAQYFKTVNLERQCEKICLIGRELLISTGRPSAIEHLDQNMKECIPIEIGMTEENWFRIKIPSLPAVKDKKAGVKYIRETLYRAMLEYFGEHDKIRFEKSFIIFNHIYPETTSKRLMRDHDNIEIKQITDILTLFLLYDDGPKNLGRIQYSTYGKDNSTEILIIPYKDLEIWCKKTV